MACVKDGRTMDEFSAAFVINKVFPKHPAFVTRDDFVQITYLNEALKLARIKSAKSTVGDCISWARNYLAEHSTMGGDA